MNRALEERIARIGAGQQGVVTFAQLVDAGLPAWSIGRRVRGGRLRALHRGVYLAGPFELPHTREMAAVLASGPGAVLSHASAAALRQLRPAEEGPVDVLVTHGRRPRTGIRLHRTRGLSDGEWSGVAGIPVTSPARTLLDLAGRLGPRELEAVVGRAERKGLVTADALSQLLERHRGHAGSRALRAVVDLSGGPAFTRSTAEEKFLALVREARLPQPRCNAMVGGYEVDFLWSAAALVVEVDGYRYHSSRRSFEDDRRKDAELVAAGLTVLRLSWRQIAREPLVTVARLAPALARGGERPGGK